jgi:hypothetical protein
VGTPTYPFANTPTAFRALGSVSKSPCFARVRCARCAYEHLVPFSCKGRGFCPSCGGRRMAEHAAHLVLGRLAALRVTLYFRYRELLRDDPIARWEARGFVEIARSRGARTRRLS